MDGRDTDKLPYGRRRRTAASALIAIVVALVLGAFFNAPAMKKTAEGMPFTKAELDEMLSLAEHGIAQLLDLQTATLATPPTPR